MYLVINLGLKSLRCIVLDVKGTEIFKESAIINTKIRGNIIEQSPRDYISVLAKILSVLKKKKLAKSIQAISVTSSANCLLGLSKNFLPTTSVATVLDLRAKNDFFEKNIKINKYIDPSHNISKIIWYKYFDKKNFYKTKYWVNNSDYLSYFFTKKLFTDHLNASKFYLKDANNTKRILNKYKINNFNLPACLEIGQTLNLDKQIVKKYNFNSNCKFVVTTYDAICACIGSLNSKNIYNNACEVSGTVTSFRYLSKNKPVNTKNLKVSYISIINSYVIGISNNLGGGIIEWYKGFLNKKNFYAHLKKSYNKSKNYLFFFPYIFGDRDLKFHVTSRGIIFGLSSGSDINDITKSVIDSTCFVSKYLFDRLKNSKNKLYSVTLSGGLSRIKFINKLKARLLNIDTYECKNFESTTIGCLILILTSLKIKTFKDALKIIKLKKIYTKKSDKSEIQNNYLFFKKFIMKNSRIFNIKNFQTKKIKSSFRNL